MDITSVSYIVFIFISLVIYWRIPYKIQWIFLLLVSISYYFINGAWYTYAYILCSVISVYFATNYFMRQDDIRKKRVGLIVTIILNVSILAILKYSNLFIKTYNFICNDSKIQLLNLVPSLAISFYTLQIISYLLDAYWGVTEIEKNPFRLLLYTTYFPLMVSGPICRHSQLGTYLFQEHRFDYDCVTRGFRRIAWGMAKKVVVADRLAIPVGVMFNNPDLYPGLWVLVAGGIFIFQLYFDFSGCMDIVIGVSNCFGIELPENFNTPFFSKSIQEFWQRWHMTLGGWLKDYIMYPVLKSDMMINLQTVCRKRWGKAGKKIPSYIAMFFVWTIMGLWHGNSWKFIIGEGLWFWITIVLGQLLEPYYVKIKKRLYIQLDS